MRKLIVATACLALVACGAPTDDGSLPGRVVPDESLDLPTREEVVTEAEPDWRVTLGVAGAAARFISTSGEFFAAAVLDEARVPVVGVGQAASGDLLATVRLPAETSWPWLVTTTEGLALVAVSTVAGTDRLRLYRLDGSIAWERTAAELGGDPTLPMKIDGVWDARIVLRQLPGMRGVYDTAPMLVVTIEGEPSWKPRDVRPRTTVVDEGLVMAAYRSDDQVDEPSDGVLVWDVLTGSQLADLPITEVQNYPLVLCGGVLNPTTVVACGMADDDVGNVWIHDWAKDETVEFEVRSSPALDRANGLVGLDLTDGRMVGYAAAEQQEAWAWPTEEVASLQVDLTHGRGGFFIGNAGPDNIVMDSRTGAPLLREPFFAINDSQFSGTTFINLVGDTVVGYRDAASAWGLGRDSQTGLLRPLP